MWRVHYLYFSLVDVNNLTRHKTGTRWEETHVKKCVTPRPSFSRLSSLDLSLTFSEEIIKYSMYPDTFHHFVLPITYSFYMVQQYIRGEQWSLKGCTDSHFIFNFWTFWANVHRSSTSTVVHLLHTCLSFPFISELMQPTCSLLVLLWLVVFVQSGLFGTFNSACCVCLPDLDLVSICAPTIVSQFACPYELVTIDLLI